MKLTGFVNIHGEPIDFDALRAKAPQQRAIVGDHRRTRTPTPMGYAALPGTGPQDKTCADCAHKTPCGNSGRAWNKCALMQQKWTHGRGTDILARSPACRRFEQKPDSTSTPE